MKQATLKKYLDILKEVKDSGKTLKQYCIFNSKLSYNSIIKTISKIREMNDKESEMVSMILTLYGQVTNKSIESFDSKSENLTSCQVETDTTSEISYERDEDGKIKYYSYQIFRRGKTPLCGKLTREEMNTIYRLYSYYGDSLTQRVISRYFIEISLIDFKRILRAFNITKASAPFAPHMFEEKTEEELREIQLREKENSFLRKAEEDNLRNNEKLLKKYAQDNIELKKQLNNITNIKIHLPEIASPYKLTVKKDLTQSVNLYLSDLHIGSRVASGSIAYDNKSFSPAEVRIRLLKVLEQLSQLGDFETINLVLLGDILDTCGVEGKTARLDHSMPTNLDCREQANEAIEILTWFVDTLVSNDLANKIRIFSVPEGNHDGVFGYVTIKAFLHLINARYPNIYTKQFEEYYGKFEQDTHKFIISHGKDARFMRKGQPLTLNDKTQVLIYEWLEENNIHGQNIHFIKGDLHTEAITTCKRFDYRSVISLYGSSDYSAMNFSASGQGCSYDLIVNNQLVRGIFKV